MKLTGGTLSTQIKGDSIMQQPYAFRTDSGKVFQVELKKVNKRTVWVQLLSKGESVKVIKLPKNSPKLMYREEIKR